MKNLFKVNGDTTTIFATRKGETHEILISTSQLDLVSSIKGTWWIHPSTNTCYAWARILGKRVKMHRFITQCPKGKEVHHRDDNGLNNTDGNLLVTTKSVNMHNLSRPQTNNKSGVTGVCWDKSKQKWKAVIKVDNKEHFLGRFDDLDEAKKVVESARKRLNLFKR